MNDLSLPFILWFPGEAALDLTSMAAPIQLSIQVAGDHPLPRRAVSSDLSKSKDDANA
jgi:hypothetical protein